MIVVGRSDNQFRRVISLTAEPMVHEGQGSEKYCSMGKMGRRTAAHSVYPRVLIICFFSHICTSNRPTGHLGNEEAAQRVENLL